MAQGKNTVDKLPCGVYIKNIVTLWGRKEVADVKKPNSRNGSCRDFAKLIEKDERSISNKIYCRTEFTRKEMVEIKKNYFPNCSLDYLFEQFQNENLFEQSNE